MFEETKKSLETVAQNAMVKLNAIIAFENYMVECVNRLEAVNCSTSDIALLPVLESLLFVPMKKENKLFIITSPFAELKIPDEIKDFTIIYITHHMDVRTKIIGGYLQQGIIPTITKVANFELPETESKPLAVNL